MRSRPYNAHSHKEETYRSGEGSRGSRIEIRSGSEGPNFDPYHYDEITVTRADGRKATIHRGLAEWMRYWDGRFERHFHDSYAILRSKFEACVGCTPEEAERTFHRLKERRITHHACGMRHIKSVDGYPGETFMLCDKCGDILDSSFDHSAIV